MRGRTPTELVDAVGIVQRGFPSGTWEVCVCLPSSLFTPTCVRCFADGVTFFFDRDRVLAGGIKREGGKRVGTTGRCDLEGEGFPSSKGFSLEQMARA